MQKVRQRMFWWSDEDLYNDAPKKNKKSTHIQKQSSDEQSNPPTAMGLQLGEFFCKTDFFLHPFHNFSVSFTFATSEETLSAQSKANTQKHVLRLKIQTDDILRNIS